MNGKLFIGIAVLAISLFVPTMPAVATGGENEDDTPDVVEIIIPDPNCWGSGNHNETKGGDFQHPVNDGDFSSSIEGEDQVSTTYNVYDENGKLIYKIMLQCLCPKEGNDGIMTLYAVFGIHTNNHIKSQLSGFTQMSEGNISNWNLKNDAKEIWYKNIFGEWSCKGDEDEDDEPAGGFLCWILLDHELAKPHYAQIWDESTETWHRWDGYLLSTLKGEAWEMSVHVNPGAAGDGNLFRISENAGAATFDLYVTESGGSCYLVGEEEPTPPPPSENECDTCVAEAHMDEELKQYQPNQYGMRVFNFDHLIGAYTYLVVLTQDFSMSCNGVEYQPETIRSNATGTYYEFYGEYPCVYFDWENEVLVDTGQILINQTDDVTNDIVWYAACTLTPDPVHRWQVHEDDEGNLTFTTYPGQAPGEIENHMVAMGYGDDSEQIAREMVANFYSISPRPLPPLPVPEASSEANILPIGQGDMPQTITLVFEYGESLSDYFLELGMSQQEMWKSGGAVERWQGYFRTTDVVTGQEYIVPESVINPEPTPAPPAQKTQLASNNEEDERQSSNNMIVGTIINPVVAVLVIVLVMFYVPLKFWWDNRKRKFTVFLPLAPGQVDRIDEFKPKRSSKPEWRRLWNLFRRLKFPIKY